MKLFRGWIPGVAALVTLVTSITLAGVATTARAQAVLALEGAPPPAVDPLTTAARSVGVQQCLPALSSISAIGVRDARHADVLFDWDRRNPNGGAVFSLLGMESESGNAAMSVTGVPAANGTCAVSAERIAYDARSCKQVAQHELAGYHATPLVPHMMVYTTAREPGSTVSLIDSASGCLMIRRYVNFGSNASVQ